MSHKNEKHPRIHTGDWVVVCDGAKALILENEGDEKFPNLRRREALEEPHASTAASGTDAPGRVQQSTSTARSSVEQTDWHDQAEQLFLNHLARRLDEALARGETRAVVIAAAPRALGMLRAAYSDRLKEALRSEIAKDLVKLPIDEIEKHLTEK